MLPESAKYKYTVLYCMAFEPVTLLLKKQKVMIKLSAVNVAYITNLMIPHWEARSNALNL